MNEEGFTNNSAVRKRASRLPATLSGQAFDF